MPHFSLFLFSGLKLDCPNFFRRFLPRRFPLLFFQVRSTHEDGSFVKVRSRVSLFPAWNCLPFFPRSLLRCPPSPLAFVRRSLHGIFSQYRSVFSPARFSFRLCCRSSCFPEEGWEKTMGPPPHLVLPYSFFFPPRTSSRSLLHAPREGPFRSLPGVMGVIVPQKRDVGLLLLGVFSCYLPHHWDSSVEALLSGFGGSFFSLAFLARTS